MKRAFFFLTLFFLVFASLGREAYAVEYDAGDLRDPFSDLEAPKEPDRVVENKELIDALELQGIVFGGNEPRAIVNGKVVKAGSKLNVGEVAKISKEGVTVRYDGKEYLLKRSDKKGKPA